jgi:DNA-binding transcriptional regulator YiaG
MVKNEFKFTEEDVKKLRKMAGLTQQKAAESMWLKSSSSWRDWENGRYNMSKGNVEYFCLKNEINFSKVLMNSGNPL